MVLLSCSDVRGLKKLRSGKVREVFDLGNELLIVSTDRISAFDVVMENGIPDKGKILNQMSAFWFEKLSHVCPNHLIATSDADIAARSPENLEILSGRTTIAKKADPLPVECVARGYLTGSLYKEYVRSGGSVHGLRLPDNLLDGSRLLEPIFTPATKATEGHDENISMKQAEDLVGVEIAAQVKEWTMQLYHEASDHALSKGLILADTKFEFGLTPDGLIWIDEALTPDSSRYWDLDLWKPGQQQPSYDKQFVRDYLESINWNKTPPGPRLPDDVIAKTREKYLEAYRLIRGRELGA